MLPENIVELTKQIPLDTGHPKITPRRGTEEPQDFNRSRYDVLTDSRISEKMFTDWNLFHSEIAYQDFDHFFDKELFVEDIDNVTLSQEIFIKLICDRTFLFINDSRSHTNAEYPNLQSAFSKELTDESTHGNVEKYKYIREHGFVPTYALKSKWNTWKEDMQRVQEALQHRIQFIARGSNLPYDYCVKSSPINEKTASTDNTTDNTLGYSELELKLAKLFFHYLDACANQTSSTDYKHYLTSFAQIQKNALPWISAILKEAESNIDTCSALWIWVLFATYTSKLAKGTLNVYKFHAPPFKNKNDLQDIAPDNQTTNTSSKKRCNIILFDHLLDLLPPPDIHYAKFQFYALTKYNRFTHYDTKPEKPFDFNCSTRFLDFVDELGGLILYHITHCLSNTPAWLTPFLPRSSKDIMNSLSCLLLHDSNVRPVKRSLTGRIDILLRNKEKAEKYITEYMHCTPRMRSSKLREIVECENLHFVPTRAFADLEILDAPNQRSCECIVLEFALRQRILPLYYKNLKGKAELLFPPELFLSDHVFSE